MSNFPCSHTSSNIMSHRMENLASHSLLVKYDYTTNILTTSLVNFSLNVERMYFLSLGVKGQLERCSSYLFIPVFHLIFSQLITPVFRSLRKKRKWSNPTIPGHFDLFFCHINILFCRMRHSYNSGQSLPGILESREKSKPTP